MKFNLIERISSLTLYSSIFIIVFASSCTNNTVPERQDEKNKEVIVDTVVGNVLSEEDLKDLSSSELMYLRNDVYARYGYTFKNQDLAEYYSQLDWYIPLYSNVDSLLTDIEKQNVELILEFEAKLKNNTEPMDEFLALFHDINNEKLQIISSEKDKYGVAIDDSDIEKYFGLKNEEVYEGCITYRVSAIAKFDLSESYIALVTHEMHCPVSNVDWYYPMYVFDKNGKYITEFLIAYKNGDSEDFTLCEVVFDKGEITQNITHTWNEWKENEDNPTGHREEYKQKIHFDPHTKEFVEVRD